ncbi:hypothetical protein C8J56DRAFT_792867, partial [Mycena floridula]
LNVTIDGDGPNHASTIQPPALGLAKWYQSPTLEDGAHSITIEPLLNTFISVDYMLVAVGENTSLLGRTLAVDDLYDEIEYGGNWKAKLADDAEFGETFQSTSHQTSTPGSSLTFTYAGSNMTVYGTFQWVQSGSFDLVAYVDDGPPLTQTFSGIPHSGWQPHFPLFSTGNLDPGQHTVTVELSKCVNQTLVFDYILYTPSFSTLASMPSMTPRITSTKKPAVSVIIGSVIGGLVLLGLFCLFFIWRKRIQKRRARDTLPAYMESMALKPFPGGASRDKSTCTDTKKI